MKNLIQSILHAHLIQPCPHGNLVGISGRRWLARQVLPDDERASVERHLSLIDQIEQALKTVETDIAHYPLGDSLIQRLMTLPGVDIHLAAGLAAAIGDTQRFSSPQKLVGYLGLNPSVRQSGEEPAYHGRITKKGRGHARGLLVEAAWAAARSPGPLRAFFGRLAARRGKHIAAVATARKLAMIVWHMLTREADYIWVRPALLARKLRTLELRAGKPASHAGRGSAYDYNLPQKRSAERLHAEMAERINAEVMWRWRTRSAAKSRRPAKSAS